ncbi:MAG: hypothetical protein ACK53Y_20025, partial [bacterium]
MNEKSTILFTIKIIKLQVIKITKHSSEFYTEGKFPCAIFAEASLLKKSLTESFIYCIIKQSNNYCQENIIKLIIEKSCAVIMA